MYGGKIKYGDTLSLVLELQINIYVPYLDVAQNLYLQQETLFFLCVQRINSKKTGPIKYNIRNLHHPKVT